MMLFTMNVEELWVFFGKRHQKHEVIRNIYKRIE